MEPNVDIRTSVILSARSEALCDITAMKFAQRVTSQWGIMIPDSKTKNYLRWGGINQGRAFAVIIRCCKWFVQSSLRCGQVAGTWDLEYHTWQPSAEARCLPSIHLRTKWSARKDGYSCWCMTTRYDKPVTSAPNRVSQACMWLDYKVTAITWN